MILVFWGILSTGFKLQDDLKWDINENDPTVWLEVDSEVLEFNFSKTEFDDDHSVLAGVEEGQQVRAIIRDIINDYNSIQTSYLRLGLPDEPATEDSDVSTYSSPGRKITISFGSSSALGGNGFATFSGSGGTMEECSITLIKSALSEAQSFKATLTHELGHCMSLDHNHADRDSIMSYNRAGGLHRLGVDEKIALTFLYPTDDEYAEELATFGLSCNRQE